MGVILNFVKDYERIARFRFGTFEGMKGPGVVIALPVVQIGRASCRERV